MRDDERDQDNEDATSVTGPSGPPADAGETYDPAMTGQDEANIPPESDADPQG